MNLVNGIKRAGARVVQSRFGTAVVGKAFAMFAFCLGLLVMVGEAAAEPPPLVDWAATATSVKDEASPAIAAAIGVGVAFLAVSIGYKMIRRFAK